VSHIEDVSPRYSEDRPDGAGDFRGGISVFFPAFNDALSLPSLLATTIATLRRAATDYEVIVVNDGSSDNTAEVLDRLRQDYHPCLRVITHEQNQGYGAALRSGLAAATKEFIFYTDGDGQYDPAELTRLLEAVTPETGLVNGYKIERNDPWHRVMIGALYNRFARWLFRIRLRDIDCDFRLIRRSALDLSQLRSTGGTICIEIVRSLELSGARVTELPVHHYPRLHGRSQFFRIPSLVNTFVQLCALFVRLVAIPAIIGGTTSSSNGTANVRERTPASRWALAILMLFCVTALSLMTYGRALRLPFISDDYIQIQLGRDYGPVAGWPALFHDALYRCRATSLVLTYWTERAFGLDPFAFNVSSLLLHIANSLLVFALGLWRPVGWKVSALAACFFAVSQRHQEAVIWYAAVPELLVFLFCLSSFLCWVHWLQSESHPVRYYAGALGFFVLALLSKESAVAVAPLCVLAISVQPGRGLKDLGWTAPFFLVSGVYFGLAFGARDTHLHFNDGTFSLSAPFWVVLARSAGGLLWVWGIVALLAFPAWRSRHWRVLLSVSAAWIILTLLPYSFLTYMPRVPSRHTYLASVGLSLIVAAWFITFREWSVNRKQGWITAVVAIGIALHQSGYVSTVKYDQYVLRAEPTEDLLRLARQSDEPIYAKCFPYSPVIGEFALKVSIPRAVFLTGPEAKAQPGAKDFCNGFAHE
jgi:hypothetical protein